VATALLLLKELAAFGSDYPTSVGPGVRDYSLIGDRQ